jgi:hypothetical protein
MPHSFRRELRQLTPETVSAAIDDFLLRALNA